MFAWYGGAGQLYSCGRVSPTRSKITSCIMPRLLVAQIYSNPRISASARIAVVLYWRVCSMYPSSTACFKSCCHPQHIAKATAAGRLIVLCTYLQPWRGTARGLRSFRVCTATRMQLADRNVSCKHCCASGLQQHLICTEDVNVTTHVAKATDIFSGGLDCIFLVEQPQNECQLIGILILHLRRRYAATAAATAATQSSMHVFIPHGLRLKADLNGSVCPGDAFVSLGSFFFIKFFLITFSPFHPNFLTNCSSQSAFSENKCPKNVFSVQ